MAATQIGDIRTVEDLLINMRVIEDPGVVGSLVQEFMATHDLEMEEQMTIMSTLSQKLRQTRSGNKPPPVTESKQQPVVAATPAENVEATTTKHVSFAEPVKQVVQLPEPDSGLFRATLAKTKAQQQPQETTKSDWEQQELEAEQQLQLKKKQLEQERLAKEYRKQQRQREQREKEQQERLQKEEEELKRQREIEDKMRKQLQEKQQKQLLEQQRLKEEQRQKQLREEEQRRKELEEQKRQKEQEEKQQKQLQEQQRLREQQEQRLRLLKEQHKQEQEEKQRQKKLQEQQKQEQEQRQKKLQEEQKRQKQLEEQKRRDEQKQKELQEQQRLKHQQALQRLKQMQEQQQKQQEEHERQKKLHEEKQRLIQARKQNLLNSQPKLPVKQSVILPQWEPVKAVAQDPAPQPTVDIQQENNPMPTTHYTATISGATQPAVAAAPVQYVVNTQPPLPPAEKPKAPEPKPPAQADQAEYYKAAWAAYYASLATETYKKETEKKPVQQRSMTVDEYAAHCLKYYQEQVKKGVALPTAAAEQQPQPQPQPVVAVAPTAAAWVPPAMNYMQQQPQLVQQPPQLVQQPPQLVQQPPQLVQQPPQLVQQPPQLAQQPVEPVQPQIAIAQQPPAQTQHDAWMAEYAAYYQWTERMRKQQFQSQEQKSNFARHAVDWYSFLEQKRTMPTTTTPTAATATPGAGQWYWQQPPPQHGHAGFVAGTTPPTTYPDNSASTPVYPPPVPQSPVKRPPPPPLMTVATPPADNGDVCVVKWPAASVATSFFGAGGQKKPNTTAQQTTIKESVQTAQKARSDSISDGQNGWSTTKPIHTSPTTPKPNKQKPTWEKTSKMLAKAQTLEEWRKIMKAQFEDSDASPQSTPAVTKPTPSVTKPTPQRKPTAAPTKPPIPLALVDTSDVYDSYQYEEEEIDEFDSELSNPRIQIWNKFHSKKKLINSIHKWHHYMADTSQGDWPPNDMAFGGNKQESGYYCDYSEEMDYGIDNDTMQEEMQEEIQEEYDYDDWGSEQEEELPQSHTQSYEYENENQWEEDASSTKPGEWEPVRTSKPTEKKAEPASNYNQTFRNDSCSNSPKKGGYDMDLSAGQYSARGAVTRAIPCLMGMELTPPPEMNDNSALPLTQYNCMSPEEAEELIKTPLAEITGASTPETMPWIFGDKQTPFAKENRVEDDKENEKHQRPASVKSASDNSEFNLDLGSDYEQEDAKDSSPKHTTRNTANNLQERSQKSLSRWDSSGPKSFTNARRKLDFDAVVHKLQRSQQHESVSANFEVLRRNVTVEGLFSRPPAVEKAIEAEQRKPVIKDEMKVEAPDSKLVTQPPSQITRLVSFFSATAQVMLGTAESSGSEVPKKEVKVDSELKSDPVNTADVLPVIVPNVLAKSSFFSPARLASKVDQNAEKEKQMKFSELLPSQVAHVVHLFPTTAENSKKRADPITDSRPAKKPSTDDLMSKISAPLPKRPKVDVRARPAVPATKPVNPPRPPYRPPVRAQALGLFPIRGAGGYPPARPPMYPGMQRPRFRPPPPGPPGYRPPNPYATGWSRFGGPNIPPRNRLLSAFGRPNI